MDAERVSSGAMQTQHVWSVAPEVMAIESDEVHVWRASLDVAPLTVEAFLQTLSRDERERADHFRFQKDRHHFIVARCALRTVLGGYLKVDPSEVRFTYGPRGKPTLALHGLSLALCFNVAHSHGLALFAITRGREVGVDVEWVSPRFTRDRIAERFFSAREVHVLRSLPRAMQDEAFFNCWTRKEAYIKAKGDGLWIALDRFEVSLAPGESAALLRVDWDPGEVFRWSLRELYPGPGYVGALAVSGQDWRLKCWQCSEQ